MAHTFIDFNYDALSSLSSEAAVKLFARLLWCGVRRRALPLASVTITTRINVADGGIDADILPNSVPADEDLLIAGNTHFQIKAGESKPWQLGWMRREVQSSRGQLGESVLHCLKSSGRYVLTCFGCDPTTPQRRQAIKNLRDIFTSFGFDGARVDIWGQSTLHSMLIGFPSLAMALSNRQDLPFLTHSQWRLDATMVVPLELGAPQLKVIEEVRGLLRGSAFGHVRLIGEPGLGKTRLLLEALSSEDLEPMVVYVRNPEDFQRSALFNAIIRSDDLSAIILVVDDCSEIDRASIWNSLRQRSHRIKLVSADFGPETSTDSLMRVLECPVLGAEQIKAILSEYIGGRDDADRWVQFCSGSPRVAHAVGENLRKNPEDILKPPATVPIWERFIHGNMRTGSRRALQHELVLRYASLFQRFGFAYPVSDEAAFIAGLVREADSSITRPIFDGIIKHYRDRRILQGKTTLFIVPRALHIHLWIQFWELYGVSIDLEELLKLMPESLFRWFTEMFKFGHGSKVCMARIERLLGASGPFSNMEFMFDRTGSQFLNELAEAHPEAVLGCIERAFQSRSEKQLTEFQGGRQYIVWALEKIAVWRSLFHRGAAMLLKLAESENATNSNNATGTFCSLFDLGFGRMASSEAPPEIRLPILAVALKSSNSEIRAIGIKALGHALADHPHVRHIGPELQGLRPLPELWSPKTWGEVWNAYRNSLKLGMEVWETNDSEKAAISKVIIQSAHHLLACRALEPDTLAAFRRICKHRATDLRRFISFVGTHRRFKWRGLSRSAVSGLRELEKSFTGVSLASKITRAVLYGTYDDLDHSKKGSYGEGHFKKLKKLARQYVSTPNKAQAPISRLFVESGFQVFAFGRAIGEADLNFRRWTPLLRRFETAGDGRRPELLAGYLCAFFLGKRQLWQATVLSILNDPALRKYARELVVASGMSEKVLNRLCELVANHEIDDKSLEGVGFSATNLTAERYVEFIDWCVKLGRPNLIAVALDVASGMFCRGKDPLPIPRRPCLDLLMARDVFENRQDHDHQWSELVKVYVAAYGDDISEILRSVLSRFDDHVIVLNTSNSQAYPQLLNLIEKSPRESWNVITELMEPIQSRRSWNIAHWLGTRYSFGHNVIAGPLSLFPMDDILAWVDRFPNERAHLIAGACPKTFSKEQGGELTRQVVIRFGEVPHVLGALSASFGTDSWVGKASEHLRQRRDQFRGWLTVETEYSIINWLSNEIESLGREIEWNEMREEREF